MGAHTGYWASFASIRRCETAPRLPLASRRGFGRSVISWMCLRKAWRPQISSALRVSNMVEIVLGALVAIGVFVFWCDVTGLLAGSRATSERRFILRGNLCNHTRISGTCFQICRFNVLLPYSKEPTTGGFDPQQSAARPSRVEILKQKGAQRCASCHSKR
jgi:hypothetical protein